MPLMYDYQEDNFVVWGNKFSVYSELGKLVNALSETIPGQFLRNPVPELRPGNSNAYIVVEDVEEREEDLRVRVSLNEDTMNGRNKHYVLEELMGTSEIKDLMKKGNAEQMRAQEYPLKTNM